MSQSPLRDYQAQLLQYALRYSVIVFLDTGTGKTRIAVELIKRLKDTLKAKSQIALFLAPTVPLVNQQADVLRSFGIATETLCGDLCQERWGRAKWSQICSTHTALVMTPDACVYALMHANLKMGGIGVLILDECHHSSKNNPYAVIMEAFYHAQAPEHRPLVLGLTASPNQAGRLQEVLGSRLVAPKDPAQVASIVSRASPSWCFCPKGTLAKRKVRVVRAVGALAKINELMEATNAYVHAKDMLVLRQRFGEDTGREHDVAYLEIEQTGPGRKDLDHIKKQVIAVTDALEQLGPWPAAVVLSQDLLSAINKLPLDFEDMQPHMLSELMDKGDLGPDARQATRKLDELKSKIESCLEGSPFPDCKAWAHGSRFGFSSRAIPCLEEAALVHTLLTVTQVVAELLATESPGDVDSIMGGMKAALAEKGDGALFLRNEGGLQAWGLRVLELVPSEVLEHQVLGLPLPSRLHHQWLKADHLPLVDPKVITMVQMVMKAKEDSKGHVDGPRGGDRLQDAASVTAGAPGPYIRWAALVFSQRRTTCLALDKLFKTLPALTGGADPEFATSMFVGNTDLTASAAPLSMSQKRQEGIRLNFSRGHLNVLFATSVGSEGLDFRQCQLVLAFDKPENVVMLVQSGGRARAVDAQYLILKDPADARAVDKLVLSEEAMREESYRLAATNMAGMTPADWTSWFTDPLNSGSRVPLAHSYESKLMAEQRLMDAYRVHSTGALILSQYAQSSVEAYCRSLPGSDRWTILQPYHAYKIDNEDRDKAMYSCTLFLPSNAAVSVVTTNDPESSDPLIWFNNKDVAKRAVCVEAIKQLHEAGALDDYLRPVLASGQRGRLGVESGNGADPGIMDAEGDLIRALPKVALTLELPRALQAQAQQQGGQQHMEQEVQQQHKAAGGKGWSGASAVAVSRSKHPAGQPASGSTLLHVYTFEIASGDDHGSEAGRRQKEQTNPPFLLYQPEFCLLLPRALPPCNELPPFQVLLSDSEAAPGARGASTGGSSSNGTAPDPCWGWARLRAGAARDGCETIVLTSAELASLEANQYVYTALMSDAVHPTLEPWSNNRGAASDRLQAWRKLMGLPALAACLSADQDSRPDDTRPGLNRYHWMIAPLSPGIDQEQQQQQQPASSEIINWASIRALASGGVPLTMLPEWPSDVAAALSGDGGSSQQVSAAPIPSPASVHIPSNDAGSFWDLRSRLLDHGVVLAMHSGKLHVARELRIDLSPGSVFPDQEEVPDTANAITYADYFRSRYGVLDVVDLSQPMLPASLSTGRGRVNRLPIRAGRRRGTPAAPADPQKATPSELISRAIASPASATSGFGPFMQPALDGGEGGGSDDVEELLSADVSEVAEAGLIRGACEVDLVPQLVALYPLSQREWQGLNQMPSLVHRLEGLLMSHQLVQGLKSSSMGKYLPDLPMPQAVTATLSAITGASCGDAEHNLELMELMGDALLKYAASLHVYLASVDDRWAHEGVLSSRRDDIVSNAALLEKAQSSSMQLHRYYRMRPFDLVAQLGRGRQGVPRPAHCAPPGEASAAEATDLEAAGPTLVKGKRLADCVEALIGAHVMHTLTSSPEGWSHGGMPRDWGLPLQLSEARQVQSPDLAGLLKGAFRLVTATGLLPGSKAGRVRGGQALPLGLTAAVEDACGFMSAAGLLQGAKPQCWRSEMEAHVQSFPEAKRLSAMEAREVAEIERLLGYTFQSKSLALQAVTHCSYPSRVAGGSYQRLEFIGDAVLGLVVTAHVLQAGLGQLDSGAVTELRSRLVSNERLAQACLSSGLHQALRLRGLLLSHIRRAGEQEKLRRSGHHIRQGVDAAGGAPAFDAPETKVLADVVEAVIGATFLDSGGNLETAAQVVHHLLGEIASDVNEAKLATEISSGYEASGRGSVLQAFGSHLRGPLLGLPGTPMSLLPRPYACGLNCSRSRALGACVGGRGRIASVSHPIRVVRASKGYLSHRLR